MGVGGLLGGGAWEGNVSPILHFTGSPEGSELGQGTKVVALGTMSPISWRISILLSPRAPQPNLPALPTQTLTLP